MRQISHAVFLRIIIWGVLGMMYTLSALFPPVAGAASVIIDVNYAHELISGQTDAGVTVQVFVRDSTDALKAESVVTAEGDGSFFVSCLDWNLGECPDIIPGDSVLVEVPGAQALVGPVGQITISPDEVADTLSGIITAPYTSTLSIECMVWPETGSGPVISSTVDPQGGSYTCDLGDVGWDLQKGETAAVAYIQPDGNRVINTFADPAPHLVMEEFAALSAAGEDGNLAFSIRVANIGDAAAENVTITLTLQNLTYLADTSGLAVATGTIPEGQQVTWDLGELGPNAAQSFHIFLSVDGAATDSLIATALVATSTPYDLGESFEKWRQWLDVIGVNDTFLTVTKQAWTTDPAPGTNLVWQVEVCNVGSTSSSELTLIDTFPDQSDAGFLSWWAADPGWTETAATADQLSLTIPTIPGYSCRKVYLRFHVSELTAFDTSLVNSAEAAAANDLSGGAYVVDEIFISEPHSNLAIDKSWQYGVLAPGGNLHYILQFSNTGNMPVVGYQETDGDQVVLAVIDTLPVGTYFVEAFLVDNGTSLPVVPISDTGDRVIFQLPDVENGYDGRLEITLQVNPDAEPGTQLTNTTEICLYNTMEGECITEPIVEEDTYEDNGSQDTQILRDHGPNLRITKEHEWLSGQQELSYRVHFENVGDVTVSNVEIRDTYPDGTTTNGTYECESAGLIADFTHTPAAYLLTWGIDSLNPGQGGTLQYIMTLNNPADVPHSYINTVEILPMEEIYPADNFATDTAILRDIGSVHFKLDEQTLLGTAVIDKTITVTTDLDELQTVSWQCPASHFYKDDPSLGGCWTLDPLTLETGSTVEVATDQHTVDIQIPDPLTAFANSTTDVVSGQINNLNSEPVSIQVGSGSEVVAEMTAQTDSSGNYVAVFEDIPTSCWAEVRYATSVNYTAVTFHRLIECDTASPAITIEKSTNGLDADTAPGPFILVGEPITWTYEVTNTGNITLTGITVTDDQGVDVSCPDNVLQTDSSMICTATGTAVTGQYGNIGTATASSPAGQTSDTDPSHYFGASPAITIEKSTNGLDADTAPGPYILAGEPVIWTYEVTNTGNITLTGITVTDDQGVEVSCPEDTLQTDSSMYCTATGTAVSGQYANTGTATATSPAGQTSDTDSSHYFGASPGDTDSDDLTDMEELQVYGSEPNNPDTDTDGLNDGDEVAYWGADWNADPDGDQLINLLDSDSDNDGLSDGVEVNILGTDPALVDTDSNGTQDGDEDFDLDGFTNIQEVQCNSDPGNPNSICARFLPFLMLLLD